MILKLILVELKANSNKLYLFETMVQQYCDWVEVNWGVKKKSNQNILKLNQVEFKKSDNFEEKNESNHFFEIDLVRIEPFS